jgi:cell division inhibitor SepF
MATVWRRAMTYLGLGPDEEYDEYDEVEPLRDHGHERPTRQGSPAGPRQGPPMRPREPEYEPSDVAYVGGVRRLQAQPVDPSPGLGTVVAASQRAPVVRAIPATATAKPHVVAPASFNEAQEVADKYKGNVPVIINLQNVDRDLSRRLIDFASGLCYGLGGTMEKVAHQVYLLTPSNVEVSAEERRRLQERGLYD